MSVLVKYDPLAECINVLFCRVLHKASKIMPPEMFWTLLFSIVDNHSVTRLSSKSVKSFSLSRNRGRLVNRLSVKKVSHCPAYSICRPMHCSEQDGFT